MSTALVIGGTRFIGRHTVRTLDDAGYDVTVFNRGRHENPFADDAGIDQIEGDRGNDAALEAAARDVEPAIVVDCVAYHPEAVRAATGVFDGVDAYVYVSSGAAYGEESIPKREDEAALCPCSEAEARDDSMATYGARKAEGDRAVFAAADGGVNAISVRPTVVYGPFDYTERLDYWIDRVRRCDRIVVPGDGQDLWHRVYVEDVAAAIRVVAEHGEAGEAYNVGDRRLLTLEDTIALIATCVDTEPTVVHASERELSVVDLAADDFTLYRGQPHVLDTEKLAGLGWASTPLRDAMERTVAEHVDSDRDGTRHDPGRDREERLLSVLETV